MISEEQRINIHVATEVLVTGTLSGAAEACIFEW